jgi:anti-sigma regulatory factor (Ser/Thr protein kinase)
VVEVTVALRRESNTVVRLVLMRTVQEALLNVRKHAEASHVHISARGDDRKVVIEVTDDGRGPTGNCYVRSDVTRPLLDHVAGRDHPAKRPNLTERDVEVLALVAEGCARLDR